MGATQLPSESPSFCAQGCSVHTVHTQVGAAHTVDTASSIMTSQVEVAVLKVCALSKSKNTMWTDGALGGSLSSSTSDGGTEGEASQGGCRPETKGLVSRLFGMDQLVPSRNPEKTDRMGQWEVGKRKKQRQWG